MRSLIPEIASPIGFCVTLVLFIIFSVILTIVLRKGSAEFKHQEMLPLGDD